MARRLKITAGVLNVRLHPHSNSIYAKWIEAIYTRRIIAQVHGDRHGMISLLDKREADDGQIHGVVTTFVVLEDDGSWFNAEKLEKATEDQVSEINIPSNLYPNAASFYFTFDINRHRIYFQTYSKGKYLTPNSAQKLFSGFAADLFIMELFNEASITVVQSQTSLQDMFGLKVISRIEITLQRPNTDIFDEDFEQKIEQHLNRTRTQEMTIVYKAQSRESITPDDDIDAAASAALTNGSIKVVGRDDNGSVVLDSKAYPETYHDQFDPEEQSEINAFRSLLPVRRR